MNDIKTFSLLYFNRKQMLAIRLSLIDCLKDSKQIIQIEEKSLISTKYLLMKNKSNTENKERSAIYQLTLFI